MKIFILHVRAGQGHKKAAEALYEEFQKRDLGQSKDIRLMDALDYTFFLFGKGYAFFYFLLVKYASWMWGFLYLLTDVWLPYPPLAFLRSLHNSLEAAKLERLLVRENPDLIVTTHFFPAEVASRLKRQGKIRSRVVVVVTDFMVHRFWVNPGTDFYVGILEETKEALLHLEVPAEKIFILGIPVASRFLMPVDREKIKAQLSLREGYLTVLITSGSFGSGPIQWAVDQINALHEKVQVIVVCGTNRGLYNSLKSLKTSLILVVLGFVDNMHELMEVADVLVSRSSGLTTCEALVKKLPMVILSKIPGQESYNAELLEKHKAAFDISGSQELGGLIRDLIKNPGKLDEVRKNMAVLAKPSASQTIVDLALKDLIR